MAHRPISSEGRGAFATERISLEAELDPELKAKGLFHLARRAEARRDYAAAAEIYRGLEGGALAESAAQRLQVLAGEGRFGDRAEFLLNNFIPQASDPNMLFAMGTAGALFKATRLLAMTRLVAAPASFLTRGFGARALAGLAGFAIEAPAFPLAGRVARAALGESQDWSARALERELASSVLVLGGMKLGGLLASANPTALARGFFRQGGMFGGILLGHRFEELAGLRQARSTASTLTEAAALLLQFNVAGRLSQAAFGEGFGRWERQVELQTRHLEHSPNGMNGRGEFLSPARLALAGAGPAESKIRGPEILMMNGESRGGEKLPPMIEVSLMQVRAGEKTMAESHLTYLETVLAEGGHHLKPQEYVALYKRLEGMSNRMSRDLNHVLGEILTRAPMDRPGPQALFEEMVHIKRFAGHRRGDTLASWSRNPSLQSSHRGALLRLAKQVFKKEPSASVEEVFTMLICSWAKLSTEGRSFYRTIASAYRFIERNQAWFMGRLDGTEFARVALQDPQLSARTRDGILRQVQATLHSNSISSPKRVKAMEVLEKLAKLGDLTLEQRHDFESRLPIWRAELIHFNSKLSPAERAAHYAELAYLITQDHVPMIEKRQFARDLQRAFFEAQPDSQYHSLMVSDALKYLGEPELTPEMRQTFVILLLKALNDSTHAEVPPFGREVHSMNQRFLIERIVRIPDEEKVRLAQHLIDELGRRDGRAERATVLISTLAELINPTPDLSQRIVRAAENAPSPLAREVARSIFERWQSIN